MYCDYICMAGRPRPCPAGDGCTVRVLIRREKPDAFTIIPRRKRTADMTPEELAALETLLERLQARAAKWMEVAE